MNHVKTFLLMTLLTVILILLGGAIAGEQGLIMAFFFALLLNFGTYWFSDTLAIKMTRSRPVSEHDAPQLYASVRRLSGNAGLPMPALYITPSTQPNAFATGRSPKKSAVAVTEGIMQALTQEELDGVLSHELAHIKNRDTLISTVATVMAGTLTFVARIGQYRLIFGGMRGGRDNSGAAILQIVALIIAPIAALIIRMAISRSREYIADESGARIAGSPTGLASALLKMQNIAERGQPMKINEATSHMFIINPFSGNDFAKIFSTHPPIEQRVARLRRIEDQPSMR
jgi:heat shock protein HtpX